MRFVLGNNRVAPLGETVGKHLLTRFLSGFHQAGIFTAHHAAAIFMNRAHEIAKQLVDFIQPAVVVEVVGFDVRNEHRSGVEIRKRLIALVSFYHIVFAFSAMSIRTVSANDAADKERGIEAHGIKSGSQHRRSGGFAMRAGNSQRIMADTQRSQHLGTMPDGQVAFLCFDELSVVFENSSRNHHYVGIEPFEIGCALTDKDLDARLAQLLGIAAFAKIRTGHFHALFLCNTSNTAHANSANTDEMNFINAMLRHE